MRIALSRGQQNRHFLTSSPHEDGNRTEHSNVYVKELGLWTKSKNIALNIFPFTHQYKENILCR
jgi:hypothetical protein